MSPVAVRPAVNLIQVLQNAGFRGPALQKAWAIAMRESGGNPRAFNGNASTGDKSYGLFQINMLGALGPARLREYGLPNEQALLNPEVNARVAYKMSKGGTDFGAWGIGPNAYAGAPSAAHQRYLQLLNQFPGTGGTGGSMGQAGQQAQALANRMAGPNIRAILGARGQYDNQVAQGEANARGFALAVAKLLKGIGPEVRRGYSNAADTTASFAKGFSDAEQHRAANENASLGSFLQKAGVPPEVAAKALAHTGGTADVLYGTSGYGPAAALQHEGAAFGAAADQLPQEALSLGNETAMKLAGDQATQDQKYAQMVAGERGKASDRALSILSGMGLNAVGGPKPGYYVDKKGNVLPDGYIWRGGHPVRSSSAQAKSLAQTLAPEQPKINEAAAKFMAAPGIPYPQYAGKNAYGKASKTLFTEYRYLLRGVPRGRQSAAKKLLNNMIRDALVSVGIKPPKALKEAPGHGAGER